MELNTALVLRLARYLRVLQKLKSLGFVKVFSNNLGDAIGVTPAVVRKDLSSIQIAGNKRGGYNIDTLITEVGRILGKQKRHEVIVVGCGRIGSALLAYREFEEEGIYMIAGFDVDPNRINRDAAPPVLPVSELESFVQQHGVEVAVIAVPDSNATEVFERMIRAGVRGFLNFTSVELKCTATSDHDNCPTRCTVQHVNIGLEIESLFYLINIGSPQNTRHHERSAP
jgi:redox-sensing transcriptional repressor